MFPRCMFSFMLRELSMERFRINEAAATAIHYTVHIFPPQQPSMWKKLTWARAARAVFFFNFPLPAQLWENYAPADMINSWVDRSTRGSASCSCTFFSEFQIDNKKKCTYWDILKLKENRNYFFFQTINYMRKTIVKFRYFYGFHLYVPNSRFTKIFTYF